MPPRRTHTKSRAGCFKCKKRRIKVCSKFQCPFHSLLLIALLAATGWWGGRVSGLKLKVSPGVGVVGGMWTCVNIWFGDSLLVSI